MLHEKDISGRLRKRKHKDEPEDPLKKNQKHSTQEGPPKSIQLNLNSCINYIKDEDPEPNGLISTIGNSNSLSNMVHRHAGP